MLIHSLLELIKRQGLVKQEALCENAVVVAEYLYLTGGLDSFRYTFKTEILSHSHNVSEHHAS